MTIETAREISSNPEVMKRLAKYLAQQCFRNTMLEDLHAGIYSGLADRCAARRAPSPACLPPLAPFFDEVGFFPDLPLDAATCCERGAPWAFLGASGFSTAAPVDWEVSFSVVDVVIS